MIEKFLEFIKDTPTAFHAAAKVRRILVENNFTELVENQPWKLEKGGKYFLGRNMSAVVAFTIPEEDGYSFNITAAHLDSPTFKLKPNKEHGNGRYLSLNTEVYGGPIYHTWMDRPLGVAGRVMLEEENRIVAKLIDFNQPLVCIPNLPIHYNREVNKGVELNPQSHMAPLFADQTVAECSLNQMIAKELGVTGEKILSSDLYLTMLERGTLVGPHQEFVMAPQIDNLECSYACLEALLKARNTKSVNVLALFDNEEIGSSTRQGAAGTLLDDVLTRISMSMGRNHEGHMQALANSFMVSADNAQGFHPNYPQKYDADNACYLNEGIVIKNAAKGAYSTDAFSSAYFQKICKSAGVKYQLNTNRSDIPGGSTLGALSIRQVSIPSVDIGLAQLAMHSAFETAGSKDFGYLVSALERFYCSSLTSSSEENLIF